MPEPASARLVDGHLATSERWVIDAAAGGGLSLAALVAARGPLHAGEAVTLVAPLATTLVRLHARGLELAEVTAETVWLAADGRPVLLPAGLRERSLVGNGGLAPDVSALAAAALHVVDRSSAGAERLIAVLEAAVAGRLDGAGLGQAVLRTVPVLPIGRPTSPRRWRPAVRVAGVVCAVVVAGIVLGGFWGRHDGGVVLAAPPPVPSVAVSASPAVSAPPTRSTTADVGRSWRHVMTTLERARAHAYAAGDPAALRAVYADGSPTGRADLRMISAMARHGQRAVGLRAYVEHATVVARTDARVVLLMTDALTAYDVVTSDGRVARRGTGRPSRSWRVTLVRTADGWRIWSVRTVLRPSRTGGSLPGRSPETAGFATARSRSAAARS